MIRYKATKLYQVIQNYNICQCQNVLFIILIRNLSAFNYSELWVNTVSRPDTLYDTERTKVVKTVTNLFESLIFN
jgi:hypothetical protein